MALPIEIFYSFLVSGSDQCYPFEAELQAEKET